MPRYTPIEAGEPVDIGQLVNKTVKVNVSCDESSGSGSGVIVAPWGTSGSIIATADHVVDGSNCVINVTKHTGELALMVKLARDTESDVALIYIGLPWAKESVSAEIPGLGQEIITTGFPWDVMKRKTWLTVTRGHVATFYEVLGDASYRITAPILPGSSGGPCWTLKGELVGLTVSYWRDESGVPFDGHYYVTAASHIWDLMDAEAEKTETLLSLEE
jgi:S1-C subfamily serine protease